MLRCINSLYNICEFQLEEELEGRCVDKESKRGETEQNLTETGGRDKASEQMCGVISGTWQVLQQSSILLCYSLGAPLNHT